MSVLGSATLISLRRLNFNFPTTIFPSPLYGSTPPGVHLRLACEQALCLGKGWKIRVEREGKGRFFFSRDFFTLSPNREPSLRLSLNQIRVSLSIINDIYHGNFSRPRADQSAHCMNISVGKLNWFWRCPLGLTRFYLHRCFFNWLFYAFWSYSSTPKRLHWNRGFWKKTVAKRKYQKR